MSIIKITPDNIENYTILANPRRTFSSASNAAANVVSSGITGSLPLFPDGSSTTKDVFKDVNGFTSSSDAEQIELHRLAASDWGKLDYVTNIYHSVNAYMSGVNFLPSSSMFSKRQNVIRFEPGAKFNPDFLRKKAVKDSLFPYYRHAYPSLQYSYTNYHSLNFVTCSYLSSDTALIYPAGTGTVALENTNFYAPSSSFTFDFYINPRYAQESINAEFTAGTIFHMSSSYAISLVTGTSRGLDGKSDGYRLLLQLSQSAEIPPSKVAISGDTVTSTQPTTDAGFLFVSPDNSLKRNTWHHVAIRWGGQYTQDGTGSFVIDGKEKSKFVITSASVMAPIQTAPNQHDSDALFIGNFYEGSNYGTNPIAGFFNPTAATEFGVIEFNPNITADPTDVQLRHPLNAEVHDLKIFNSYRSINQILTSSKQGLGYDPYYNQAGVTGSQPSLSGSSGEEGLLFYVPPFFTKQSPKRYVNQTPFFYATGTTEDPFNVAMSFGIGGHELNLPNFTREFVRGFYPRPYGLEAARVDTSTAGSGQTANYWIYESGSNRKRNITVLPCDNGRFYPNFRTLLSGNMTTAKSGSILDKFRNDFAGLDLSRIDLNEMVSTSSLPGASAPGDNLTKFPDGLLAPIIGPTPEDPGVSPGNILTILQRTKDPSSNEVVFFDISNMFYGDQIKPQSVVLKDMSVTGSNGRVQMTLKDDGYGNLYRADSESEHAKWASVGNVIYEEGILIIKSPNIPLFGSDAWELTFEGQKNIHVLEVSVPVSKGIFNSSSNPTFQKLIPNSYPNETADSFVYLTGMQFHDENLNVVSRVNFSQPAIKREGDKYTIRVRMDY